jgi:hypothetical protein
MATAGHVAVNGGVTNGVAYWNGAGAGQLGSTAAGANTQVLIGNTGNAPSWSSTLTSPHIDTGFFDSCELASGTISGAPLVIGNFVSPIEVVTTIDTTNFVVNLALMTHSITATTNVNLQSTVNRRAGATNNVGTLLRILASGVNVIVTKNASWKTIRGIEIWPTSGVVVTNGDWFIVSFQNFGDSETNVVVGGTYAH